MAEKEPPNGRIPVAFPELRPIDPSENVKALSEAANKRQDDLREASERLVAARLTGLEELTLLRAVHVQEIAAAESQRVNEQLSLRASYEERLAQAEAKRIDAIRAVDVNAVSVASQRAADQATVLATQVQQSAEALRTLVASTAATNAQAQQQANAGLSTRITTLEQVQYEGKGKQAFQDPAIAQVLAEVKSLREGNAQGTGRSEGISAVWVAIASVITLIIGIVGTVAIIRPSSAPVPIVIEQRADGTFVPKQQ